MRYTALHGSPGPLFSQFEADRSGTQSGYDHAVGSACFTSEIDVASHYAEQSGFIGRWAFRLDNPLECDDVDRPMGIASFLEHARSEGHDGVVLRNCDHTAISPGTPSDVYYVFDLTAPRLVETIQEGSLEQPKPKRRR
jgi:hypothetical protein